MTTDQPPAATPETPAPPAPATGVEDKGFPDETRIADMTVEEQASYWKAQARKAEDLVKRKTAGASAEEVRALKEKARRLDELEEASKSELEKAQARAEAAEKALAEASVTALRATVAADKGVPASLLSGSTQEELEAAADALLAFKGVTPKAPPADGQGKVGTPVTGPDQWTRDDLKGKSPQEIEAAREAGHLRDLLNPKTT